MTEYAETHEATRVAIRERWLEIQLIASHAAFVGAAYQFSLLIHIACDAHQATLVVARRPTPDAPVIVEERPLELSAVDHTVALLRELRFPGRHLAVRPGVALEAEWFGSTILHVRTGGWPGAAGSVEIGPHGFQGEDAEGLRQLLRHLMRLAGVPKGDSWWILTGVYEGS